MAKKTIKKEETVAKPTVKKGLDIKIKTTGPKNGRIDIEVTLLQDGEVIAKDNDWVYLD